MKRFVDNIKLKFFKTPLSFRRGLGLSASDGGWMFLPVFAGLFLLGFFFARSEKSDIQTIKRTQILMGTVVEIQVKDNDREKAEFAISKAFDEIKRIDNLFSSYKQDSPVWKINNGGSNAAKLPKELLELIIFSDSLWRISDGAFDVSLGNLIELWGFSSELPSVPSEGKLAEKLTASGWKNIRLKNSNTLLLDKKVKFDFGAVAKGYAVDKAIELIKQRGITSALVNAGGEVKGFGNNWVVGVQHPRNRNEILSKLKINEMSIATSGDYEQYFEQNGKRYHHILNPETGMPANDCQSVTIISEENRMADALATAVFVLGPEKGMKLVESLSDVEAMMVNSNGKTVFSRGFNKFLLR